MTEAEWLACTSWPPMWEFVRDRVSDRTLRLAACACCRRVWHLLKQDRSRSAVEAAERLADGLISEREADDILHRDAGPWKRPPRTDDYSVARSTLIRHRAVTLAVPALVIGLFADTPDSRVRENRGQADLLRDIVGNPFRSVPFDRSWRTSAVVDLATGMYGSRDFGPMPVLADALEDAGCADPDVLAHCRGDGPHFRGCWVVDLVLGRE